MNLAPEFCAESDWHFSVSTRRLGLTIISEMLFWNVYWLEIHLTLKDETVSVWFEDAARTAQ